MLKKLMLAGMLALTPLAVQAGWWPLSEMNAHIDQTNFMVNSGCSGTLIDLKERYVLTANHCITAQYETIEREKISPEGIVTKEKVRRMKDGTVSQYEFLNADSIRTVEYKVRVVKTDSSKDLALLQIMSSIPNDRAAKLSCRDPVRGEMVWTVGNPLGSLYSSVVQGIVSSTERNYDGLQFSDAWNGKNRLVQISGGVVGGNSGGATYNDSGQLIGVPVVAHRNNEVLGFTVPRKDIQEFLENKVDFGCKAADTMPKTQPGHKTDER
jgi:S1-C subfamily serine protease